MNLEEMRALVRELSDFVPKDGREYQIIWQLFLQVPKLVDVAEAAKDEVIFWNESYCNRAESEQMEAAKRRLFEALAALEAE